MTVPRPAKPSQPPPASAKSAEPPRAKTAKEEAIAWAKAIGAALLIWIVLRSFLVEAFRIPSASMENTLLIGDFLFVNKAVFGGELEIPLIGIHCCRLPAFGTPRRDEVIVFRSVEDSTPDLNIVKRLIGVPGDTLQMVHDTVIRNRQRLDEPYALHTALPPAQSVAAAAVHRQEPRSLQADDPRLGPDRGAATALLGDGGQSRRILRQ